MKKLLFTLLCVCFALQHIHAEVEFDDNTKYQFRSALYGVGSLVMGANHGQSPYLYYDTQSNDAADAWWYIRKSGNGYTISNAVDGEYITHDTYRIEGVAKGLVLSISASTDMSRWTLNAYGDYFTIQNVGDTSQWWNLRTDGSYLLGTFTGSGSQNELFSIIDENGNVIKPEGGSTGGGGGTTTPTESDSFISATQGITAEGEYWERTSLTNPIVYTTDTTNPVLYSIANVRSAKFLQDNGSSLVQTDDPEARTHFYFVNNGSGTQVYSENGRYVSTSYTTSYQSSASPLDMKQGMASGNIWTINPDEDYINMEYVTGYVLQKLDNLPTTTSTGGRPGQQNKQSSYLFWNDYNQANVGLYDVDGGSLFVFTSSDQRHIDHLAENGITFTGGGIGAISFKTAVDSLRLQDKQFVYDATSKTYFMPIPSTLQNGGTANVTLTMKPKAGFEGYYVQLDGQKPDANTNEITLSNPDCSRTYPITLFTPTDSLVATAAVQFTFLPLVEMNVPACNGTYYTTGDIRVTNADIVGHDSTFIAAYKYRGATAQGKQKKAYAVKLRDELGNSVDRSFFGLRSDNNWILDAMAVDPACMRNRLSTDLWNAFSTAPYYKDREKKARTGTRGHFVEMFLNGKYNGIYCMTEKLDRKQLKLKKFVPAAESTTGADEVHGLLYKSADWSYEVFMGHNSDSNYFPGTAPSSYTNKMGQESWKGYEIKYPDYEEEAVEWGPLWEGINFVATSSQAEFESGVKEHFDYPVLKDYYLFIDLLLATDNHGKNMFYYVYDRAGAEGDRLGLAPWDLDGVWGARWDGSTYLTYADQDFDDFLWQNEHGELTTFYKLRQSTTLNWNEELQARYAELRGSYFNEDYLTSCVDAYASLFANSYADQREQNRWSIYHANIQQAANYMKTWMKQRISALDAKYGFDPVMSSINETQAADYFRVNGAEGAVTITSGDNRNVNIYNLAGQLVQRTTVHQGFNVVKGLQPGIYVVNGSKVVVR